MNLPKWIFNFVATLFKNQQILTLSVTTNSFLIIVRYHFWSVEANKFVWNFRNLLLIDNNKLIKAERSH
jgi:hypothetical protein